MNKRRRSQNLRAFNGIAHGQSAKHELILNSLCDLIPMKDLVIDNSRFPGMINQLVEISKPQPQTTSDGKTVTRDFEFTPKAKVLLSRDLKTLKSAWELIDERRQDLAVAYLPKGEDSTPEEKAEFLKEARALLKETTTVALHQLTLHYEKTEQPDAIDLTKAKIPFHMLVDLLDTILIDPESSNGDAKE